MSKHRGTPRWRREVKRCDHTVIKDGQPQLCDRPLDDRGYCDRPGDHVDA